MVFWALLDLYSVEEPAGPKDEYLFWPAVFLSYFVVKAVDGFGMETTALLSVHGSILVLLVGSWLAAACRGPDRLRDLLWLRDYGYYRLCCPDSWRLLSALSWSDAVLGEKLTRLLALPGSRRLACAPNAAIGFGNVGLCMFSARRDFLRCILALSAVVVLLWRPLLPCPSPELAEARRFLCWELSRSLMDVFLTRVTCLGYWRP